MNSYDTSMAATYQSFATLMLLWMIAFLLACPILSAVVAGSKGRDKSGWFMVGLVFGPFGLLAACGMSDNRERV